MEFYYDSFFFLYIRKIEMKRKINMCDKAQKTDKHEKKILLLATVCVKV